jgi:hypothetical protein
MTKVLVGPTLSLADAAKALRMSYHTTRLLAQSGILLAQRTPQGWMVSAAQVDAIKPQSEPE